MANEGPPLSPSVLGTASFPKKHVSSSGGARRHVDGRWAARVGDGQSGGGSLGRLWPRSTPWAYLKNTFYPKRFQVYGGAGCLLPGSDVQSLRTTPCKHGQPLGAAPFQVSPHLIHTEKPRPLLP